MDEAPVRPGDVLGQKYRVDKVLGVGGMGVVVAATHMDLDQRVALKFMLAGAFKDPDSLARFQREARAAVRLKSEHVARVLDTGTFENNSPYIVMEYLEGHDLSAELARVGTLPLPLAAEYILHACDAIAEAHSLGIVHRDLKPANLFLTVRQDGSPLVKVLDFGISKTNAVNEGVAAMTSTAAMMGSPLYMSPEQMKSTKNVDPRTDVWSLGIILYELLGGRVPFNSETLGDLLSQVMMDTQPSLSTLRSDLPRDISDLVDRCLEKDRAKRIQNVAEIARALGPYVPPRALPIVERVATVLGASSGRHATAASPVASTRLLQPSAPPPSSPQLSGPYPSAPYPSAPQQSALQPSPPQHYAPAASANLHGPPGIQTSPAWGGTAASSPARRSNAVVWLVGTAVAALILVAVGWSFRGRLSQSAHAPVESPSTIVPAQPTGPSLIPPQAAVDTATIPTAPSGSDVPTASASASARAAAPPPTPRTAPASLKPTGRGPAAESPPSPTTKPAAVVAAPPTPPTAAPAAPAKPGILDTSN